MDKNDILDYVTETPENTNFAIAEVIEGSGGGDTGEVWLVGDTGVEEEEMMTFSLSNVGDTDHLSELYTNAERYSVYLNGVELPYYTEQDFGEGAAQKIFADSAEETSATKFVQMINSSTPVTAFAVYIDASTSPTSVEVSIRTK